MKGLKAVTFLILCFFGSFFASASSLLASSIKSFVKDFYTKHQLNVDIYHFGFKNGENAGMLSNLLNEKNMTVTFRVRQNLRQKLKESSILVFDRLNFFAAFCKQVSWQSHPTYRNKHLVYVTNLTHLDILRNVFDGFMIDNVNFLMNVTENTIDLVSSFMFTKEKCRSNQLFTINRFERSTMKWNNSNFFPDKYKNLYGCDVFAIKLSDKYIKSEVGSRIFDSMSKYINCSIKTIKYVEDQKRTANSLFDMFGITKELQFGLFDGNSLSHTLVTGKFIFYIPPGELLTQLEKMLQPFADDSWLAIIVTLLILFSIIQLTKLLPMKWQDFIFGKNIKTPTLNFVEIFLCGGQNKIPMRNFSRFLLTLLLWWALIIRTCYQSDLYKYLQTDSRWPEVKSIEEMIEKNFTFLNSLQVFYIFGKNGNKQNPL